MGRTRSRRILCRKIGFKKGVASVNKGTNFCFEQHSTSRKYVRLYKEQFQNRIITSEGTLTFKDVDGTDTGAVPLRPLTEETKPIYQYVEPEDTNVHPDLLTMKPYCPKLVQDMFNSEIKSHNDSNKSCTGKLEFDGAGSRQRTLAFAERLKCTKCTYVSKYYKLYEEIVTGKRGRRAAKINVGLQLGLMSTPISNTGAIRILAHANMIPPHRASMQTMSNKVSASVETLNKQNMHDIRQNLREENEKCGHKDASKVNVEGDSCYNNPLFNSDTTPFQAGTIVTTTMCENNTKEKKS